MIVGIMIACGVGYLLLQCLKLLLAAIYAHRYRAVAATWSALSRERCSITIVQPILSGDPQLASTLGHNVVQLPPSVRFLWLIDEADQPAIATAMAIDPHLEIVTAADSHDEALASSIRVRVLLCPPSAHDQNPKSFKLQLALPHVDTDYFAVVDDDTCIDQESIHAAINALDSFDLYTGLPSYRRSKHVLSDCLAHFVNHNSVLTYLPPLVLFPPISLNGMFYVTRTSTLKAIGGHEAIVNELCDDYALHRWFIGNQKTVCQGLSRQEIATSIAHWTHYFRQMHRWNVFALVLTRDQPKLIQCYLVMFLGLPPVLLLVHVILAGIGMLRGSGWAVGMLVLLLVVRQTIVYASHLVAFRQGLSVNSGLSLFVELMQPLFVGWAILDPVIHWRGRKIRVLADGRFKELQSS